MGDYYSEHLGGLRLEEVYQLASPRIRQYLRAETEHVVRRVSGMGRVLELGCGYGRALRVIAPHVGRAVGADIAPSSVSYGKRFLRDVANSELVRMDAARTGFRDASFDAVICIQNGISAFGVSRPLLLTEATRLTRDGGVVLFSSYSPGIWEERLEWFRAQSRAGLVGELDESQSRDGTIVCKDGFRSFTVPGEEFSALFRGIGESPSIREIDGSSVFAEVVKSGVRPEPKR